MRRRISPNDKLRSLSRRFRRRQQSGERRQKAGVLPGLSAAVRSGSRRERRGPSRRRRGLTDPIFPSKPASDGASDHIGATVSAACASARAPRLPRPDALANASPRSSSPSSAWEIRRQKQKSVVLLTNAETSRSIRSTAARGEERRGEGEGRVRGDIGVIQQRLSPVFEEQASGGSQINLSFGTFLLSPAAPPSPSRSTMEAVSRLARPAVRKGITRARFLPRRGWKPHGNASPSRNFLPFFFFFLTAP